MSRLFSAHSPLRIFAFSIAASLAIVLGVLFGVGPDALVITLILALVEITFSFENAIINAKTLSKLSRPWQTIFLSVGILVAIFGMRVVFPVVIVMLTAHLSWGRVVDLALHHPHTYAEHLDKAHASIASFGAAFLLMLALTFFMDENKHVHWIRVVERPLHRFSHWLAAPAIVVVALVGFAHLPANDHPNQTLTAGLLGAATYILIQTLSGAFARLQGKRADEGHQTGLTALSSLIYLEVLDASFSFDGVIGAFAITSNVVLIAAGLGIGALWVRSLTVFMVRRRMLSQYVFVEHGAHYTVFVLAALLLASVLWNISDYVPGLLGVGIIGASVVASLQERRSRSLTRRGGDHF
ncbi:MAG TPA: DUF475 domain-containing protein [Candidatus Saccharimonadales bacterium]|nr:DUF475 domain-containing protein [Candidatus Saccharimonadales bacterium]